MSAPHSIVWRRIDLPGHEAARLIPRDGRWRLEGVAVLVHDSLPCRLDYRVDLDEAFATRGARIAGWVGLREVELDIASGPDGVWRVGGTTAPQLAGCIDLDLGFSPATNLLPIRRLALEGRTEADLQAAWLPFPSFGFERLAQRYTRIGPHRWRYESRGGSFAAELSVDDAGFVTEYPGLWICETGRAGG